MTITAKLIADSVDRETGIRLPTFQLRYPRFIHSEFMTHRVLSRNASSSRAIPVERLIQDILDDTAMPIRWGRNQPGMQAGEDWDAGIRGEGVSPFCTFDNEFDEISKEEAWFHARDKMIQHARAYSNAEYHKQIVNRLLEPFAHINVVVSGTDWMNFFNLRAHKDAQPEFQVLAIRMAEALKESTPERLDPGQFHLPYITDAERLSGAPDDQLAMWSSARCARVSYLTHDGKPPTDRDDETLFDQLAGSDPQHASPLEHPAKATGTTEMFYNLRGFQSFRYMWDQSAPGMVEPVFSHEVVIGG